MSITGTADGPPMRTGPAIIDFLGGTHLYAAVVTALFERQQSGHGVTGRAGVHDVAAQSGPILDLAGADQPRRGHQGGGFHRQKRRFDAACVQ